MNVQKKIATLFAFALAATVLSVGSGFAQMNTTNARGTFTLPFEARWGTASLPAGNYTFEEGNTNTGQRIIEVRGESKGSPRAFVLVQTHTPNAYDNSSELVCIRKGSTGIVRSLMLKGLGEILYFAIPKNVQMYAHNGNAKTQTLLAQGPELIQRVPVELGGQ
jgi:hypothetical protein